MSHVTTESRNAPLPPKVRHEVAELAAQGRRWFANPPQGFELPPHYASMSVGMYARHFYPNALAHKFAGRINRDEAHEKTVHLTYTHVIQSWLKQNGPTFFVDPDLLEACENTDVIGSVTGDDIKTVFPNGYFSLPVSAGFRSKYTGDVLRHIWFAIFERKDEVTVFWLNGQKYDNHLFAAGRRLFMMGNWSNSSDVSSFSLPLDMEGKTLREAIDETKVLLDIGNPARLADDSLLKLEGEEIGEWMGSLCANLCLIMQSYPQYMEPLSKEKSARTSFRDFPPPSSVIITRSSKKNLQQVVQGNPSPTSPPTGLTREMKRRRGHWRRQPHGDRFELENPEVKIIILPDGRHAHMKWIDLWLNPNIFDTTSPTLT